MSTGAGVDEPDPTKMGTGPTINGSIEAMLTPDLLYRMNKKIAQLTKVVYGLNTRGEELEAQLIGTKESEEALRTLNNDLSHKANHYKTKYDTDLGRVHTLEQQAGQANYWKAEAESLKRRLDLEGGGTGPMGDANARLAISSAREETDRALRREKAVSYELEQARQAIIQLKSHHDFIIRERDGQMAMEREKVILEWQTRMADVENRYKSQIRRVQDEMEVMQSEMEILRRRTSNQNEEKNLREQIGDKQIQHDRERREWESRASKREQEFEDEKMRYNQLKREMDQKIRNKDVGERRAIEDWEDKLREKGRQCESTVRELNGKVDMLQHLLDDKEEEFESRLKSKVVEWKTEWDGTEEGLRSEIRRLKNENDNMNVEMGTHGIQNDSFKVEEASLTNKMDSIIVESAVKVSELEDQLLQKSKECDEINRNFKVRLNCLENENKMKSSQKDDLERQIRDEKERYKTLLKKHDNLNNNVKGDMEGKVRSLTEQTIKLQEEKDKLKLEMEQLRKQKDDELHKKISEKATNMKAEMDKERQEIENKMKIKTEKIWLEKLRKTEENSNTEIERARKAQKQVEEGLRQEKDHAQKAEEDAKRLNEEFKKKIRNMRQSETDAGHQLGEIEERMTELKRREESLSEAHRSELSACEARFQPQVDSLTVKLASKQDEFTKLSQQLTAKQEEVNRLTQQLECDKSQNHQQQVLATATAAAAVTAPTTAIPEDIQEKLKELEETNIKIEQMQTHLSEHTTKIETMQNRLHDKENKIEELRISITEKDSKLEELQGSLHDKEAKLEEAKLNLTEKERKYATTHVELQYKVKELEILRTKLLKQDSDITAMAKRNLEQQIEIGQLEDNDDDDDDDDSEEQIEELEAKITILEEKMKKVEQERDQLKTTLTEIEEERDDEIKIIQDALDEAAQEREELIQTFEKELSNLTAINTTREQQLMEDFEWKMREMEKDHKKKMEEKNSLLEERINSVRSLVESDTEAALLRSRRNVDQEEVESEFRQKMEKSRSEINSEWEDKLRSECSRLKGELDQLHAEEKHLAVESMKLKKEQETQTLKKAWELKQEELSKEITTLKDSLTDKDSYYHGEMDSMRTSSDREIWDLRRKLQKLDENMWNQKEVYDEKIQHLQGEYKEHLENTEKRLAMFENPASSKAEMEKLYKEQMQSMADQHRINLERLREELDAEKFQALEESRVLVSKHMEYINSTLRDQLTEACSNNQLYREELEAVQMALMRREEVIKSQEEEMKKLKDQNSLAASSAQLAYSDTSLHSADSHPYFFQNSRASQDRDRRSESIGTSIDEEQKASGGLLNKMFGSGWFSTTKTKENGSKSSKENSRRGSKHSP